MCWVGEVCPGGCLPRGGVCQWQGGLPRGCTPHTPPPGPEEDIPRDDHWSGRYASHSFPISTLDRGTHPTLSRSRLSISCYDPSPPRWTSWGADAFITAVHVPTVHACFTGQSHDMTADQGFKPLPDGNNYSITRELYNLSSWWLFGEKTSTTIYYLDYLVFRLEGGI